MLMGISWILVGLAIGFIANRKLNFRGDDPRLDLGVGVVGAFVGGIVFNLFTDGPTARFNFWSLLIAAIGSIVALVIWHFVRTRSPYKIPTSRRSY
jgi:uncharacterized membrane protein YeaQ/YmgE (transglycosylase-associated protein family)